MTGVYGVSLRIHSKYGKIRTKKTTFLDTFHAVTVQNTNTNSGGILNLITRWIL